MTKRKTTLSISKPTPLWATYLFRFTFIFTGVATFVIAADPAIGEMATLRAGVYLKALDMLVWGITRMIGVEVTRDFNYKNGEANDGK